MNAEALSGFVADLSEDQFKTFSELMGKYVSVNTKELGSALEGKNLDESKVTVGATEYAVKGADVDAEIKVLAETKKISYFAAAQEYAESHKS